MSLLHLQTVFQTGDVLAGLGFLALYRITQQINEERGFQVAYQYQLITKSLARNEPSRAAALVALSTRDAGTLRQAIASVDAEAQLARAQLSSRLSDTRAPARFARTGDGASGVHLGAAAAAGTAIGAGRKGACYAFNRDSAGCTRGSQCAYFSGHACEVCGARDHGARGGHPG